LGDADLAEAGAVPLRWPEPPPVPPLQRHAEIGWAALFGSREPRLLRDSDVFSMASSLELRVPFLDHRLVELALRLPQRFHGPAKGLLRDHLRLSPQAVAAAFPGSEAIAPEPGLLRG
ncbi:MAG: asparagine synthase-related protein, partial [Acetobacteraceae bacterium]